MPAEKLPNSSSKMFFSGPGCSKWAYIRRCCVAMICLPFLRCQPSSAITTIVINEGSIYQPGLRLDFFSFSPRFVPAPAPIANPSAQWFISSSVSTPPPLLPHPSIPLFPTPLFSLCLLRRTEMLPATRPGGRRRPRLPSINLSGG